MKWLAGFTRMALVGALLSMMGAHLIIFQSAAWARMAIIFSHRDHLTTSLQETLDGKHPCALCLKIKRVIDSHAELKAFHLPMKIESLPPALAVIGNHRMTLWSVHAAEPLFTSSHCAQDAPPPKHTFL